jgi:hypothetical protein
LIETSGRLIIPAKHFSDFLERYKGKRVARENLKRETGIKRKPENRYFEAFLLRSFLYKVSKSDPKYLEPFLLENNWSDYAKSWTISENLHYPFRGKIAFIVSEKNGKKKLVCHPQRSELVEKIIFEPGFLTLRIPGVNLEPRHKAKVCQKLLQYCGSSNYISIDELKKIKKETHTNPESFLVLLRSLELLKKQGSSYLIDGPHLFCEEFRKSNGFSDLEKAARVILRKDVEKMQYITTVLLWIEARERFVEPWNEPIGIGKDEDEYLKLAIIETSLNSAAISDVLKEFSKFNAFFEYYRRELIGQIGYECYVTLSCHADSLGLVGAYLESTLDLSKIFKTSFRKEKFERHVKYLLRFIDEKSLTSAINRKDLNLIRRKLTKSEIINLNISNYSREIVSDQCFSNVFIISKLPVKDEYFKENVIETLRKPHIWKNRQGYFYYPDFRFIMSAKMGLTFNAFDRLLAYHIQDDVDFYSKLYLPILWGIRIKEHKIDESLKSVVPEPFDSISLKA